MPTLAQNRKARFNYELLENYEGGLVLTGAEVKAAKRGHINMKGAFLSVVNGELWLKNMHIGKYAPAGKQEDYVPTRNRKVLVKLRQIKSLMGKKDQKGLTIVPISVYTKGGLVKLGFSVAKGRKVHEKRAALKKRDVDRQIRNELKK